MNTDVTLDATLVKYGSDGDDCCFSGGISRTVRDLVPLSARNDQLASGHVIVQSDHCACASRGTLTSFPDEVRS